eukprot:2680977-Pyramimonas_sp.AAC.1
MSPYRSSFLSLCIDEDSDRAQVVDREIMLKDIGFDPKGLLLLFVLPASSSSNHGSHPLPPRRRVVLGGFATLSNCSSLRRPAPCARLVACSRQLASTLPLGLGPPRHLHLHMGPSPCRGITPVCLSAPQLRDILKLGWGGGVLGDIWGALAF